MTKTEALKIVNHISKLICKSNKSAMLRFEMRGKKPEIDFMYAVEFGRAKSVTISYWYDKELVEEAVKKIEKLLNEEEVHDE